MSPEQYRQHREQLGLTQAGLAARLGLPRTAIVKREGGDQRITAEAVVALRALKAAKTNAPGGSNVKDQRRPAATLRRDQKTSRSGQG